MNILLMSFRAVTTIQPLKATRRKFINQETKESLEKIIASNVKKWGLEVMRKKKQGNIISLHNADD